MSGFILYEGYRLENKMLIRFKYFIRKFIELKLKNYS
jgi:hypothetical protein